MTGKRRRDYIQKIGFVLIFGCVQIHFFDFLFFIFLTFNLYIVKILIVADMNPLCGTPGCVSFFIKKFFRCFLQVSVCGGGDKMLCENSRPIFRKKFEKTVAIPERV